MTPRFRVLASAVALAAMLAAGVTTAQQPPPPQPPGGQPPPAGQVPNQPRVQRVQPGQLPPGFAPPGGRPGAPGGPPGRPGLPPGFPPQRPRPQPAAHAAEAESAGGAHGGGHAHCPGHGPLDPPAHINWWQGMLMVDNEKAQSASLVNRILFRYENHENPCDPKNQPAPFLASLLNFSVFAFLVYRFGKKPLAEALVKRKTTIMTEIDAAAKLKAEAEARLHQYEDKLEQMEDTLAQLRAEYDAQAKQEKAHLLAEADEKRARMRRDAEFRIEQELKTVRAELLHSAVVGAVAAAEELLTKKIAQADMDRMAEDYLRAVGPAMVPGTPAKAASTQGVSA